MSGDSKTVEVDGVGFNTKGLGDIENQIFDEQFPILVNNYANSFADKGVSRAVANILMSNMEEFRFLASVAKSEIEPNPGAFEGMTPISGFGFRFIRPDDIFPSEQGRTFDRAVSALTKDNWYGVFHHAAIGGAYNASPLYLRKEMLLGIAGHMDLGATPIIEEIQWEIESRPKAVFNMVQQMRSEVPVFAYPKVIPLRPAKTYRSQGKFAAVAANVAPMPIGIAFVSAEYMRTVQPTVPDSTAP